ncbi:hypothetical protein WJX73_002913 [Symbiochloris irregularis]|uniref:Uncharacterized protein n=1 Tax=Symbiochloris irregularis TaxID=706552 RepID=A0AAW1NST9_9CHLO
MLSAAHLYAFPISLYLAAALGYQSVHTLVNELSLYASQTSGTTASSRGGARLFGIDPALKDASHARDSRGFTPCILTCKHRRQDV